MYSIDTELLPLECGPREALEIYLYRTMFFVSAIVVATIPFTILLLYSSYTRPNSVSLLPYSWFVLVLHLVAALGLAYFAWVLRNRESILRDAALVLKIYDEVHERSNVLLEWIDSINFDEISTSEQVEKLKLLVKEAEAEANELYAIGNKIKQKVSRVTLQSDDMVQRIADINRHINAVQEALSKIDKAVPPLRKRFSP